MASNSIPYLPNSIAVGLQPNLIQYLIELKFLLLFFEKPLAILSTPDFDFIDIETLDAVKRGERISTNFWGAPTALKHVEVLATDEWQEIMSHCTTWYYNYRVSHLDKHLRYFSEEGETSNSKGLGKIAGSEEIPQRVDEIVAATGLGSDISTLELMALLRQNDKKMNKKIKSKLFGEIIVRLGFQRLLEVLERCRAERIPMVWGNVADLDIVEIYTHYLLDKHFQKSADPEVNATHRLLEGSRLLNELLDLEVVNLATAPVSRIISFRKSNSDLLENFLVDYRSFLTELQNTPQDGEKIVLNWTQKIVSDLNTLNKELLLTRREKEYKWLQRLSDAAYEGAKKGAVAAIWSFLGNPMLFAGAIGGMILDAAQKFSGDTGNRKEKEEALLFRSSSGYLWKARKKFS